MRKIIAAAVAAFTLVCAWVAPAWAVGEFSSGNWRGYAVFNNNRFSLCRMSANYGSDFTLTFGINSREEVLVALANRTWNLSVGGKPEMRIQIDGGAPLVRTGDIVDRITVVMYITSSDSIFQQLRYGRGIRFSVGSATESFTLQGTAAALVRLLDCKRRYS